MRLDCELGLVVGGSTSARQIDSPTTRHIPATYKGLWTKLKKNLAHRKAGHTKKRYKGLDKPPRYISPTVTYNYGYDYGFKSEQQVSVLTLAGRIILPYQGYDLHVAFIQHGAHLGGAKLWYDKAHKQFYLLVSLELDLPDPTPETLPDVVGVDVAMRYLATTATMNNDSHFYPGKRVRAKADHEARLRKRLQHKGTRSATRRKIALSGRERRLKLQTNHIIAKSIVNAHPHTLIGLEELTGFRKRTKRRRRRRKKHGKGTEPVSSKARRANRHVSKWAFAELHGLIVYKAVLSRSSLAIKVDPDYTSQACPLCGYTDKRNRPGKGLQFICRNEQCVYRLCTGQPYTLHADLVGARNIAMRTLLIRQDWIRMGVLSVRPDVSGSETKAARLARSAELRWSSDASSSFSGDGVTDAYHGQPCARRSAQRRSGLRPSYSHRNTGCVGADQPGRED